LLNVFPKSPIMNCICRKGGHIFSQEFFFLYFYILTGFILICLPPPRGCAGGGIGTRFLRPRGSSPLKGVNSWEPRGIEMGPRASSAWRVVRRLFGMYTFTTKPFFGWDVNRTEIPCWEIATLFARYRTQFNSSLWALCSWWLVIGDLLHWLNYPSLPFTFPCFNSRGI
jgi:hypothetical protein